MIKVGTTSLQYIPEALKELKKLIYTPGDTAAVIFFVSTFYNVNSVAQIARMEFPDCETFGCTSGGEIFSTGFGETGMQNNSIIAMSFSKGLFKRTHFEVIEFMREDYATAFRNIGDAFQSTALELDPEKYFGLVLTSGSDDGFAKREEHMMDNFITYSNIRFVGGAAGDDFRFYRTNVFYNGNVYTDAALLFVAEVTKKMAFAKIHSFTPTEHTFTVTKAQNRQIFELDGKNAVDVYLNALGNPDRSDAKLMGGIYITNPLAVQVNNDLFIRSILDTCFGYISLACDIDEGAKICIAKANDIMKHTDDFISSMLRSAVSEHTEPVGIIGFNCAYRMIQVTMAADPEDAKNGCPLTFKRHSEAFKRVPSVILSSYGEMYVVNMNQTLTCVMFY